LLLKKEEKEKISSYLIEINSKIVSNNNKISENLSIKKKISTIDICQLAYKM
jgi:hypothetical protein